MPDGSSAAKWRTSCWPLLLVFLRRAILAQAITAKNVAAAYATFFASLCTLGINSVIVKNFVDHPDQQGETIGTTLLLRAVSSLLSALAIIGIVSIVDRGERLTVVVVALYSIGLIFQVFDTLNYWFQARLQSKYSAIAELVSYAAMSVYKIILLALGIWRYYRGLRKQKS